MKIGQAEEAQAQPSRGACERGFHVVLVGYAEAPCRKARDGGEKNPAPSVDPVKEALADGRRRSSAEIGSWGR